MTIFLTMLNIIVKCIYDVPSKKIKTMEVIYVWNEIFDTGYGDAG